MLQDSVHEEALAELKVVQVVRRHWHPWHRLRGVPCFQTIVHFVGVPVRVKLYGIGHPARLLPARNLLYWVMKGVLEPEIVALFLSINRSFAPQVV